MNRTTPDPIGSSLRRLFPDYTKRWARPGEATSRANDLWARPVYVPVAAPVRPGSLDAYAIPSRGIGA